MTARACHGRTGTFGLSDTRVITSSYPPERESDDHQCVYVYTAAQLTRDAATGTIDPGNAANPVTKLVLYTLL